MSANVVQLPRALFAEKMRIDALGGAEAYPYNETLDARFLLGLERLQAISDRALAASLYELYWLAERNSTDPMQAAREERERQAREDAERDHVASVCEQALSGRLGPEALEEAREVLVDQYGRTRTDEASMRECACRVQQIRLRA